jgi:hypothetical protein
VIGEKPSGGTTGAAMDFGLTQGADGSAPHPTLS